MKIKVPFSCIRKQLVYDLIGKDSYRGVTLSYAWLANQSGHFALGFVPTCFMYQWLRHCWAIEYPAKVAAWSIALLWLLFEVFNVLKSIFFSKPKGGFTFRPQWGNVVFDTATDVLVFAIGAFAASVACNWCHNLWIEWLVAMLLFLYPAYYWYTTKICQQQADFPFQFRLSQWEGGLTEEQKRTVLLFLAQGLNHQSQHLLVTGAINSGKTSIGIGIGNELAIQHQAVSYVTATKLLELFYLPNPALENNRLWHWRNAGTLIIDDINPSLPDGINNTFLTPELVNKHLQNSRMGKENKDALLQQNVIWILGSGSGGQAQLSDWQSMLQQLGVAPRQITCLHLP